MIDAARLRQLPHVIAVATIRHTERRETAERGSCKAQGIQMTCVDENYWRTIAPYLETGRLIDASDMAEQAKVCVLPRDVRNELFGPEDPLGKTITVRGYPYTVVGTLGELKILKFRGPSLFRCHFHRITSGISGSSCL